MKNLQKQSRNGGKNYILSCQPIFVVKIGVLSTKMSRKTYKEANHRTRKKFQTELEKLEKEFGFDKYLLDLLRWISELLKIRKIYLLVGKKSVNNLILEAKSENQKAKKTVN